jgi:hypothetical protein
MMRTVFITVYSSLSLLGGLTRSIEQRSGNASLRRNLVKLIYPREWWAEFEKSQIERLRFGASFVVCNASARGEDTAFERRCSKGMSPECYDKRDIMFNISTGLRFIPTMQ